jgi:hypothetical protein
MAPTFVGGSLQGRFLDLRVIALPSSTSSRFCCLLMPESGNEKSEMQLGKAQQAYRRKLSSCRGLSSLARRIAVEALD